MRHAVAGLLFLAGVLCASPSLAQPAFSAAFQPSTIGVNSSSTLRFVINNSAGADATQLAFTDILPAGMTVAVSALVSNSCGGNVTAVAGGTAISLSDGVVTAAASCAIEVDVTAAAAATLVNVTGDLTSGLGNSGTASATLTVSGDRIGFSKSFAPSAVAVGDPARLTFSFDNSGSAGPSFNGSFTDALPAGLVIADPPRLVHDCAGLTPSAAANDSSVSAFGLQLNAATSCTLGVDVRAQLPGTLVNRSSDLSDFRGTAGKAVASLEATITRLSLRKEFIDDPLAPGAQGLVRYRILNANRDTTAVAITFSDDFNAALGGLQAATPLPANPCGPGSSLSGTGVLTLSGGQLASGDSCEFSVPLQVPAGATAGAYASTTSAISASVGGLGQIGNAATDTLSVQPVPRLVITNLTSPLSAGDAFTLQFELTNTSGTDAATAIGFTLPYGPLGGATLVTPLPGGFCGAGAVMVDSVGTRSIFVSGGALAAGGSCVFTANLQLAAEAATGTYTSTSSNVTATVGGAAVSGPGASLSVDVLSAPRLSHEFIGPIVAGGTATLRYRLSTFESQPAASTAIAFSHDLDAVLSGLTATDTPISGSCGAGSLLTGTSTLSFTGGSLAPADSCSVDVTVQVPAGVIGGSYPSATSAVSAQVTGQTVASASSSAALNVTSLRLAHSFIDAPVLRGTAVTLRFSMENVGASNITDISFSENLSAALSGMAAVAPLPTAPCGAGSSLSGTTTLVFAGGELPAGMSCTFDVTVQVPAGAASGSYGVATSAVSATENATGITAPRALAQLEVTQLSLLHSYVDDPVAPGGTVSVQYVISNPAASGAPAAGIAFSHDLDAVVSGLVVAGPLPATPCGAGSSFTGTSVLTLANGTLAPGGSCSFVATLAVPGTVGGSFPSITSPLSASGQAPAPASADLLMVDPIGLALQLLSASAPGGSPTLQITLQNLSSNAYADLRFTLDLGAGLAGLAATGLPQADVCGSGSQLSGSGVLSLVGGSLAASGSCSFSLTLAVPGMAAAGVYPLTSSELTSSGLRVGVAGSSSLEVVRAGFSKAFAPASTVVGGTSVLTFTIDNSAAGVALSGLQLNDTLPAGMQVGTPANSSTTCTGGVLTAAAGGTVISYSGGALAAGGICTVQANVRATAAGALVNTSAPLQTSIGNMGTASATLSVSAVAGFSKAFAPATVFANAPSTLTFNIDNSGSASALSGLAFSDSFPAGMVVAAVPSPVSGCAGTLTAAAGSASISFSGGSVAAGATCAVSVDVQAASPGSYLNTSSPLSTGFSPAPAASATLTVSAAPQFAKAFAPASISVDQTSVLVFTIDNAAGSLAVTGLDFTDALPAGLSVATPANASTTCTGGALTAASGSGSVSYAGGSLGAGATCTVSVDVRAAGGGSYVNTSGDLTSSAGNSGGATATLTVSDAPLLFSKTILPASALAGGQVTVSYQLQNASTTVAASALTFSDDFAALIPGAAAVGLPQVNPCGAGSQLSGSGVVTLSGGQLAAGAQCSFSVDVQLPGTALPGAYTSTSSTVSGAGGIGIASGPAASALINIVALPVFSKEMPASAQPGALISLRFTLTQPALGGSVSNLSFSDDLDAFMPGARAESLPLSGVCGAGSVVSGSSVVSFQGGSLSAGQSCSFVVPVRLPTMVSGSSFTNITSPLSGSFGAVTLVGGPGSAASRGLALAAARPELIPVGGWPLGLLMVILLGGLGALRLRR